MRLSLETLTHRLLPPGGVFQVSVVAMQRGEQLTPFRTRSGDTLELLHLDELSAEVGPDLVPPLHASLAALHV